MSKSEAMEMKRSACTSPLRKKNPIKYRYSIF